jgi:hypothetical protein
MKFNQSLTAAITAAALVAGAGFAYAQSGTAPGAPGDLNAQGSATMKVPATPDASTSTTMQAQPSTGRTGTGTSMDTSNSVASPSGTVMPEPRADRN